jgi:hypothetical protein
MSRFQRLGVAALIASLGCGVAADARAALTGVFDLQWNGPETSTVTERVDDLDFYFTYPMRGGLQMDLDPQVPRLINVESDILLPACGVPGCPAAISPSVWFNFDLLEGEYVAPANEGDISLVFRPADAGGSLRPFELFVDITDGGQMLSLTGGVEQDPTSPLEPDAAFNVSGRLLGEGEELSSRAVPEPTGALLMALGAASLAISASRRC